MRSLNIYIIVNTEYEMNFKQFDKYIYIDKIISDG